MDLSKTPYPRSLPYKQEYSKDFTIYRLESARMATHSTTYQSTNTCPLDRIKEKHSEYRRPKTARDGNGQAFTP